MTDGFLRLSPAGAVTASNPMAETLLQTAGMPIIGQHLDAVIPDFVGSEASAQVIAASRGSIARRIEHFAASRYTWFELRVIPRPDGAYILMRNITDRVRQMQSEAVRASVREIIKDAPVAISITRGPEHRYELINERSRQLVGGRNLEGRTMLNAFPELAGSDIIRRIDEVYATGVSYTGTNVQLQFDRQGNGDLVDGVFDFTYQPLFDPDGSVSGVLSVAVDVTDYAQQLDLQT